jgi:hypothetical protein
MLAALPAAEDFFLRCIIVKVMLSVPYLRNNLQPIDITGYTAEDREVQRYGRLFAFRRQSAKIRAIFLCRREFAPEADP